MEFLENAFSLPGGLEWDNYARAYEKSTLAAIFIQATYIMIPLFLQMNSFYLLNNLAALEVLYATMQFPFAIFLLSGFLKTIPRDYEEAPMIDGCGPFRILLNIIVPMSKAGIVTVCMISAMAAWNEYPVALIPTVILFVIGQRQLVQGMSVGGIKG